MARSRSFDVASAPASGRRRSAWGALVVFALASAGCDYTGDAEIEPEPTVAAPAAATPGAGESGGETGARPPARSAYGKAMEAAHRLEDKVEDYNKKLEQAADDAFK